MSEELKANFERPDLYSELAEALGCDPMDSHQGRLNRAARAKAALAHPAPAGWMPIDSAPQDGFMLVHEDGAIRALMRIKGVWHKPGYPAIVNDWGDAIVGDDAKRLLPKGCRLELRDGCCESPTHWMPIDAPNAQEPA